jgi:hypothetical protein
MKKWLKYPIVIIFFAFLMSFAVVDELWPKRERSELENRTLAQFPKLTLSSLLEKDSDKTWMAKYSEYTQDQVALRDQWINLKSLTETALLKCENNGVWFGKDDYLFAELLSVNEKRFDKNLSALERMCERNPGIVDIMIVPSASLILEDDLPWMAPIADEGAYLDQIDERLGSVATVYDMRPVLNANSDEYIYYRTDHHWTSYGAYLAYSEYVQSKGLTPMDLSQETAIDVGDFYGTNYSKSRKFGAIPDTITYYDLPNALTILNLNEQGEEVEEVGALYNLSDFDTRDKYKAFLRGNNGYSTLKGNGTGSILVVKDSYANCFVPYLVANYADIGIVDFRYTNEKIDSFIARGNYDRVLVLYSFQGFAEDIQLAGRVATA